MASRNSFTAGYGRREIVRSTISPCSLSTMTSRPSIGRTRIGLLNTMFSASSALTWAGVALPDSRSLRKGCIVISPISRRLRSVVRVCKPFQSGQARHEEVLASAKHVERFDAVDATSYRLLRDGERCSSLLQPDNRVTLVTGTDEIAVVDPL